MTVLEVMIAMGLMSVALLSILAVFTGSLDSISRTEEMTEATDAGRDVLEKIKSRGFEQLPGGTTTFDGRVPQPAMTRPTLYPYPPAPYPARKASSGRQYSLRVRTEPVNVNLTSVTVEVHWESNTKQQKLVLQTYLHP